MKKCTVKDCLSVTCIMSSTTSKSMAPGMESLPTPSHCKHAMQRHNIRCMNDEVELVILNYTSTIPQYKT